MWLPSCPWPCFTSERNVLLVGFSEIGEDVDSLARHHIKESKDLVSYGLMTNLMRGKTNQYLKMWLQNREWGGGGGHAPRICLEVFIANGAFWINLDHQLRAEILPIFINIVYSSPATYFILVIVNMMDCLCIDADTRRGSCWKGSAWIRPWIPHGIQNVLLKSDF